jgi:hypothetical protein
MDEQSFVDLMEMVIIPMKMARKPKPIDIPIIITEMLSGMTLPGLENLLEIKNSSIHGKGVFAKNDIHPNQVVSLYPCHGMIKGKIKYCEEKQSGDYDDLLFNPNNYKIKLKTSDISMYGNPYIQDEGLVGHLINDSYKDVSDLEKLNKHNIKNCFKYMLNSIKCDNCNLVQGNDYVYVKTTKHINKGEELFTHYGYPFWCFELKTSEIDLLMKEYILSLSVSQQLYIKELFKQFCHTSPIPSEKIKALFSDPSFVNAMIYDAMIMMNSK